MQVHVLIFFCLLVKIIKSNSDSDEAKYIDLLPEEEKQEFLNRIAKRIVAEIKSHNRMDKSSVEISDEKLNEHAAYVEKIMDEETDNLRHERRLGSETLEDKIQNNDSELRGKTLENEDFVAHYQSETDFTPSKNKKRIKKDTNEDSKPLSIENSNKEIDETVSEIPVRLVFESSESNLNYKPATTKTDFNDKDTINEDLVEDKGLNTNQFDQEDNKSLEKTHNHNKTIQTLYKKQDNESKEINTVHNLEVLQDSYVGYAEMAVTTFLPGTIINDFELEGEESRPITHTTIQNSTAETQIRQIDNINNKGLRKTIVDIDKVKLFKRSTENILKMSPDSTDNINSEIQSTINDALIANSQNYSVNIVSPILRNTDLLGRQSNESFSGIYNNTNENILKTGTNEYIPQTTSSIDNAINLSTNTPKNGSAGIFLTTSKSSIDYDGLNNESIWRESNKSHDNITTQHIIEETEHTSDNVKYLKQALRQGTENSKQVENEYTEKYTSKMKSPNSLSSNEINNYRVFEVSHHSPPFIPSKQINFGEEPHYIPVYNYEPNNAFYTGYNHYGRNIDENGKINEAIQHERNPIPDYIKSYTNKQNENLMNSQRNFKLYYKNQENGQPRSIAYSMPPVWKGRFSDINFNPNDYLDMDYYLGRTNGAYNNMYNDFSNIKPQNFVTNKKWHDNSDDVIDPNASLEPNNMKSNIANLRTKLYVHKHGKKDTSIDIYTKNNNRYTLKTFLRKRKTTHDPNLRGLDETFVIFLPGRDKDTNDEKNIAVDYYFSRMNSEELHGDHTNDALFERLPDNLNVQRDKENKQKGTDVLKNAKEKSGKVIEEKHIHIPLKRDNILKIDLAVKNGNKVDVIFKKAKIPETNKNDDYFNSYLVVLKDMIEHDNAGLLKYSWLESTVDIQSAIKKLLDLMNSLQEASEQVHYSDCELFKYILYVFQSSKKLLKEATKPRGNYKQRKNNPKGKFGRIASPPKVNKNFTGNMEKPLDTLSRIYKEIEEIQQLSEIISNKTLFEFENYLSDLQTSLTTLHEAIKGIAAITKFNNQTWFHDLKDLYLTPVDRKVALTLLLHLATSKLYSLIEDSAKNGLEDNFIIYVQSHREEVGRTREEFVFALRILKEIKILEN